MHTFVAGGHIPNTDDALTVGTGLFAGQQNGAVVDKHAMSVELAPLRWRQFVQDLPGKAVDDQGKAAGTTGKGDGLGAMGMACTGMPARRQRHLKSCAAIARNSEQRKGPIRNARRRDVAGVAHVRPSNRWRGAGCQ